jgi:hypothetical protein
VSRLLLPLGVVLWLAGTAVAVWAVARPEAEPAPRPPVTVTLPAPRPLPAPAVPADPCRVRPWEDPECSRKLTASLERYPGELDQYRGHGGGRVPSWQPSRPRPIPPYPALPGDPNDRDRDGRACEARCVN